MAQITFYEKPGCIANRKQKALLNASGHDLELRNILTEDWTPETLRPFFGSHPVSHWFNRSAPAVKSGAVIPEEMDENAAVVAMCADPLLIRRPLMQSDGERRCGFDTDDVRAWIGLVEASAPVGDTCERTASPVCSDPD